MCQKDPEYDPFLTWEEVKRLYNLPYCREHIFGKDRMIARGLFPKPLVLGSCKRGRVAWRKSQIEAWIASLPGYEPLSDADGDEALD